MNSLLPVTGFLLHENNIDIASKAKLNLFIGTSSLSMDLDACISLFFLFRLKYIQIVSLYNCYHFLLNDCIYQQSVDICVEIKIVKKLIPSIFTSANLLCGFFAIWMQDIYIGSILLLVAMLMDVFDGRLARQLDVATDVGKELDSFADLVSFGVAPAILYLTFSPIDDWIKFIPAGCYVLGAALRLARFNLLPSSKYFLGLATPPAAFFMIGIFLGVHHQESIISELIMTPAIYVAVPVILALLMNAKFKMFSLKSINSGLKRDIYFPLIVLLFFIAILLINSKVAIPSSILFYLTMALLYNFVSRREEKLN